MKYLNRSNRHPGRIRKVDRMFESKLDFKDIKFPIKIRDTHKIEKRNCFGISVFGYDNNKKIRLMCPKIHPKNMLIKDFSALINV